MFYTVYRITNNVNGKIYIGVHKTEDLEDGYMGSGTLLKRAQQKHGIENFSKEYLAIFDNPEEMFEMESQLVNSDFVNSYATYNLKEGGYGGWTTINMSGKNLYRDSDGKVLNGNDKNFQNIIIEHGSVFSYLKKQKPEAYEKVKNKISNSAKSSYEDGTRTNGFLGRKHSEKAKLKIGSINAIHQKGDKNSQFGTMWIYNSEPKINKKIPKDSPIENGWVKGRKTF